MARGVFFGALSVLAVAYSTGKDSILISEETGLDF